MTDTPKTEPVKAWAVIRNDGYYDADRVFKSQWDAVNFAGDNSIIYPQYAPFRVVHAQVTITKGQTDE